MSVLVGAVETLNAFEPWAVVLLVMILLIYLIFLGGAVLVYVFHALSLYTVAKRRGIHHPWLSWIPVGDMWILGSISDQYQYLVKGKIRNRRYLLLWLYVAVYCGTLIATIGGILMSVAAESLFVTIAGISLLGFSAAAVVAAVFFYIAQYDFYRSCDPNNAVVFLIVGMVIDVTQPIFQFVCRKKDLGMPARKQPDVENVYCE